jgi:hypothetical protein
MKNRLLWTGASLLALLAGACSDSTTGRVSLALTTTRPTAAPLAAVAPTGALGAPRVSAAGDSAVIVMGNDTAIVRSVEVVLREIELKRVEAAGCDSVTGNDDCEEFETGPVLATLPLGTTATATMIAVNAPPGQYDKLQFEVHKPESSNDAAFIAAHPGFDGVSIRVTGTYSQAGTRSDFVFTSDLNVGQEAFLSPPLTVSDGAATNVTLRLDIATWFTNEAGTALVDPASANKGQPNESVVKNHIHDSVEAFRDDDHDGHDDDNEGT